MITTKFFTFKSHNPAPKLMDITDKVERVVKASKIQQGQVLVFSRHTTAAIVLQEKEPGLQQDLQKLICQLAPQEAVYAHSLSVDHQIDQRPNGHSHCQCLLLGSSEIIPIYDGQMALGQYQRIFLVELDRKKLRSIVVQATGE